MFRSRATLPYRYLSLSDSVHHSPADDLPLPRRVLMTPKEGLTHEP